MEVLGLDIGGTNSRIALIQVNGSKLKILKQKTILTNNVTDVSKFITQFNNKIENGCIGFAGPIIGNKAKLTNANLSISIKDLKKNTQLKNVALVNDFLANGHGVRFLKKSELYTLHDGKGIKDIQVSVVAGPGTGLGKVYLIDNKVYACEPGWTSIGIEDIDDYSLIDYLKRKYKRQSYYEDILSGRGLIDIYDHLEIKSNLDTNMRIRKLIKEEPVHKAKVLIKYSSKDKLCDMTLNIFTKFYARFIRDSCLGMLTSKVYLVGGISTAIKPYIKKHFMKEFLNHSVYRPILKKVQIYIVTNEHVGLIGAGAVAASL
jgi:glucokinase